MAREPGNTAIPVMRAAVQESVNGASSPILLGPQPARFYVGNV